MAMGVKQKIELRGLEEAKKLEKGMHTRSDYEEMLGKTEGYKR